MNRIVEVFFGSFILFFIFCSFGFCIPVNSNADIGKVLELNDLELADAVKKLDNAMQIVKKNEEKKKRKIEFKNPVKIFDLSDKYSVISYNSKFDSGEDAVVGFLVIKAEKKIEVPGPHLIWRGETDITAFYSITDDVLCKYFRDMGINDVYPIYSSMKLRNKIDAKADKKHNHSGNDITEGIVSEKFIDDSITRDSELKDALAKKADISMIMTMKQQEDKQEQKADAGIVNQLQAKIAELEKKIERLNFLLSGVVRKNNDIYFDNMNIHVRNGTGKTESSNYTGNIIIGYNEGGNVSGSHNLVAGTGCKASSYCGVVSGKNNIISKPYGIAAGGSGNEVTEIFGVSVGGKTNKASGKYSTVVGGEKNNAKGDFSIIAGGKNRSVVNENPHFTQ